MATELKDVTDYHLICDATADRVAVTYALAWLTTDLT